MFNVLCKKIKKETISTFNKTTIESTSELKSFCNMNTSVMTDSETKKRSSLSSWTTHQMSKKLKLTDGAPSETLSSSPTESVMEQDDLTYSEIDGLADQGQVIPLKTTLNKVSGSYFSFFFSNQSEKEAISTDETESEINGVINSDQFNWCLNVIFAGTDLDTINRALDSVYFSSNRLEKSSSIDEFEQVAYNY